MYAIRTWFAYWDSALKAPIGILNVSCNEQPRSFHADFFFFFLDLNSRKKKKKAFAYLLLLRRERLIKILKVIGVRVRQQRQFGAMATWCYESIWIPYLGGKNESSPWHG